MEITRITGTTPIDVSLATYKAIETRRQCFDETHDAILLRTLLTREHDAPPAIASAPVAARVARPARTGRRRGRVTVTLFGQARAALNLRDAYLVALTALVRHKASLIVLLAHEGTPKRRWVATTAEDLYAGSPHLAQQHAYQVAPAWFVDTTVSHAQIVARLRVAARLAGLRYGQDVEVVDA